MSAISRLEESSPRDHERRKQLAEALLALPLETAAAIEARDSCGQAYAKLAESNLVSAALKAALDGGAAEGPDTQKLVAQLSQAETLISESEPLLERCRLARQQLVLYSD